MNIRNATEFRNFTNANQLNGLHNYIAAVGICIADYERGCSCWKAGDREKIYSNCKALYVRAVGLVMAQYAANFLAKTPDRRIFFSQDGVSIGEVSR